LPFDMEVPRLTSARGVEPSGLSRGGVETHVIAAVTNIVLGQETDSAKRVRPRERETERERERDRERHLLTIKDR
jgi:hypothetical protein